MNVLVDYDNGVTLSYSLNAFNSWEGYTIVFNGTKGRLEHTSKEKIYVSGTDTEQGGIIKGGISTVIIPLRGPTRNMEVWTGEGSHGGGTDIYWTTCFYPIRRRISICGPLTNVPALIQYSRGWRPTAVLLQVTA